MKRNENKIHNRKNLRKMSEMESKTMLLNLILYLKSTWLYGSLIYIYRNDMVIRLYIQTN